jgi:hypothetical protein
MYLPRKNIFVSLSTKLYSVTRMLLMVHLGKLNHMNQIVIGASVH